MTEENQHLGGTDETSTSEEERESKETSEEFASLFDEESKDDEPVSREEYNRLLKGVKKLASQKGRETKDSKEQTQVKKETPTSQSNDDVTELFLENKPDAARVIDDLKIVADAKYNGSILKAWKGEAWIQEKAKALTEVDIAKSKIQSPSNQIEGEINFEKVTAEQISKMSGKDYSRYQEFLRKGSSTGGMIRL